MGCAGPGAKTSPANTLNLRTAGNDMDALAADDPDHAAKIAFEHVMGARDAALSAIAGRGLAIS